MVTQEKMAGFRTIKSHAHFTRHQCHAHYSMWSTGAESKAYTAWMEQSTSEQSTILTMTHDRGTACLGEAGKGNSEGGSS